MRHCLLYILIAVIAIPVSMAQDGPDTVIRIENQVPDYERTAQELLQSNQEDIVNHGKLLLPPGEGDDTKERFILTILAKDASSPRHEDKRAMVEQAFLEMLETASHDEIKDFLLTQFHLFGSEASIDTLGKYLIHDKLYINASIALLSIGSPAAAPHFLAAIPSVKPDAQATFLRALGDLKYKEGIDQINIFLASENDGVRLAAIYALAKIGGLDVYETLLKAVHGETGIIKPQALACLFDYANSLIGEGQGYTSAQIANDILSSYKEPNDSHLTCAALELLVDAKKGYAIYDLMKYAGHELADVSAAALALAEKIPGKEYMELWLEKAEKSDEPLKSKIMAMLDGRDDYHAWFDIEYPPVSLDTPNDEGFTYLFNNVDLTGWVGDTNGYLVEDTKLVCAPGGNLYTEKEYSDFVLRFEFKLPPGGNNGLGVRAPLTGNSAYQGMELQILDTEHPMYKTIKPWQAHGSVYGVIPAKRGYLRDAGQWNREEVIAAGNRIIVKLNGTVIVNGDIKKASENGTMDGHDHPGLLNETGHLGFLGHGSRVEFRNIRIKELDLPEIIETAVETVEEAAVEETAEEEETQSNDWGKDSGL